MNTKKLIPEHELNAMREWLLHHNDVSGGLMDIHKEWKRQTGLSKFER